MERGLSEVYHSPVRPKRASVAGVCADKSMSRSSVTARVRAYRRRVIFGPLAVCRARAQTVDGACPLKDDHPRDLQIGEVLCGLPVPVKWRLNYGTGETDDLLRGRRDTDDWPSPLSENASLPSIEAGLKETRDLGDGFRVRKLLCDGTKEGRTETRASFSLICVVPTNYYSFICQGLTSTETFQYWTFLVFDTLDNLR